MGNTVTFRTSSEIPFYHTGHGKHTGTRKSQGICKVITPFFLARPFGSEKADTCGKTRHQIKMFSNGIIRQRPSETAIYGWLCMVVCRGNLVFQTCPCRLCKCLVRQFASVMRPPDCLRMSDPEIVLNFRFPNLLTNNNLQRHKNSSNPCPHPKSCPNVAHSCLF